MSKGTSSSVSCTFWSNVHFCAIWLCFVWCLILWNCKFGCKNCPYYKGKTFLSVKTTYDFGKESFQCKLSNRIGVSLHPVLLRLNFQLQLLWMNVWQKENTLLYKDNRSSMWKLFFFFSSLVFGMVNAQKTERHVEKRYWKFLFASMNLRRIPIFDFIYILTFNVHILLLLNIR